MVGKARFFRAWLINKKKNTGQTKLVDFFWVGELGLERGRFRLLKVVCLLYTVGRNE